MSDPRDLTVRAGVRALAAGAVVCGLIAALLTLSSGRVEVASQIEAACVVLLGAAALWVQRRSGPRAAARVLLLLGWLVVVRNAAAGSIYSPASGGLLVIVLAAGMLLSAREALAAGIASGGATLLIAAAQSDVPFTLWANRQPTAGLLIPQMMLLGAATAVAVWTGRRLTAAMRDAAQEQQRMRSLVETGPLGFVALDRDLIVTHLNANLAAWLDLPATEAQIGRSLADTRSGQVPAIQSAVLAATQEHRSSSFEASWVLEAGRRVSLWLWVSPIFDGDGEWVGVEAVVEDLSERQELEEALRQAQKMEAIANLAGGVAHDFNNSLTVILGETTDLLDELPADDPAHERLAAVREAAERSAALTRSLLAFGRRQPHRPALVDLRELVERNERLIGRLLGERVLVSSEHAGDAFVFADAAALEQVLMNFAVNARDAMPGGGSFRIRTAAIELESATAERLPGTKPGSYSALEVRDSGTGIDGEVLPHIFEPFFTTKAPGKGTGLGLSIAHGIIQQAGGAIEVSTSRGAGTTFRVLLPLSERPLAQSAHAAGRERARPGEGRTILLVEDEMPVRRLAARILRQAGYDVIAAKDAADAMEMFRRGSHIDLLVTDVVMPDRSGPELAAELRAIVPDLPILFASGYARSELSEMSEEMTLLAKPFAPLDLLDAVAGALDRSS